MVLLLLLRFTTVCRREHEHDNSKTRQSVLFNRHVSRRLTQVGVLSVCDGENQDVAREDAREQVAILIELAHVVKRTCEEAITPRQARKINTFEAAPEARKSLN